MAADEKMIKNDDLDPMKIGHIQTDRNSFSWVTNYYNKKERWSEAIAFRNRENAEIYSVLVEIREILREENPKLMEKLRGVRKKSNVKIAEKRARSYVHTSKRTRK